MQTKSPKAYKVNISTRFKYITPKSDDFNSKFLEVFYSKSTPCKAYINFLLYSIADSSLFNINLTLSNLNKLLQRRPTTYTASTALV